MVYKKDSFKIDNFKITSNGYLDISGIVTRSGVFKYEDGGELRPAAEVFKQDSLDTMFAIPVTWEHPPDLLTSNTISLYEKGFVASKAVVEKTDNDRGVVKLSNIIIKDKNLIDEIISNNIKQFSLGYSCDLDEKVGKFDNEDFVRLQKNIVYNHLAVVKDARCGEVCSIIKKEDSMSKKEFKKDCACQSEKRQDEKEKSEELKKEKEELEKVEEEKDLHGKDPKAKEEVKEDEEEKEPSWTKKMFEQHGKMLEALEKLISMQKSEDKEPKKDDDDQDDDLYDSKKKDEMKDEDEKEEEMKKDKRKDSVKETISSFKFESNNQTRTDSETFKTYNRDDFLKSLLNKGAK
jgi:hypothetical protein